MAFFITLEGGEGSGKTTQAELLSIWLETNGYEVLRTREPGGCLIADRIRAILLDPAHQGMAADAELLLYAAARAQHVAEVIRPALTRGQIVICDRYTAATLAYQGYGRGLDLDLIRTMNKLAVGTARPDLTLLLDYPTTAGVARARQRNQGNKGENEGRFEAEEEDFHNRVRDGYLQLAAEDKSISVIDARGSIEEVQMRLRQALNRRLPLPAPDRP
ncbi:dTMP kinase [Geothermobacter hydrogeniphilus]|uniref:Thymidylate kinase n=1 Tax=Geothermobacter hydrogeniphilus TaxID=1969733 RepID=A0A2K2H9L8_9BACT|nr:dTMP kinase [Geothermobacter hydrogeniphilus]PNU20015.1 dTMP kinase [Geothermobacter hydrogeniphilus]